MSEASVLEAASRNRFVASSEFAASIPAEPFRRAAIELSDAKRIESFRFRRTFAADRFATNLRALDALLRGHDGDVESVCREFEPLAKRELLRGLIATRAGGLDLTMLADAGCSRRRLVEVIHQVLDYHREAIASELRSELLKTAEVWIDESSAVSNSSMRSVKPQASSEDLSAIDAVCESLHREPRAGATAPGHSRALVSPTESQSEHCYSVAVLSTLMSGWTAAPAGRVFAVGISHHLYNSVLPDIGFSGEVLLGDDLDRVLHWARGRVSERLGSHWHDMIETAATAMSHLADATSQTVNACDAIDRVLQSHYHQKVADFHAARVCQELQLVHEGPLQDFQNGTLRQLGIES